MITIRALKLLAAASCLATAILAYVGGCTQNSKMVQDQYILDVTRVSDEPQTQGQGVLKVRRFAISSPFETHEFVYRKAKSRYATSLQMLSIRSAVSTMTTCSKATFRLFTAITAVKRKLMR